jgi:predicted ArsR family transcriptional regulator
LRGSTRTVNELAEKLELTDNAVRAHLLSLERDGLIKQSGVLRGTRKPHFAYELTTEAEHLFPKAYDALLNQLIAELKGRLTPSALEEILRAVGRSLAGSQTPDEDSETVEKGVMALEAIGGTARSVNEDEKVFIRSASCPLATAVAEHPEVCLLAEALLTEVIGKQVRKRCNLEGSPRCSFEILKS